MRLVAVEQGYDPREVDISSSSNEQGVLLGRCPNKPGFRAVRICFLHNETKILALSRNHCSVTVAAAASSSSRRHAVVRVVDEGSNNGVIVDGVLLEKYSTSAPLRPGALIRLSRSVDPAVVYRYEVDDDDDEADRTVVVEAAPAPAPAEDEKKKEEEAWEAGLVSELKAGLECAGCRQTLRPPVACLACGHCFCATTTCLPTAGPVCPLCQTMSAAAACTAAGQVLAFRCAPLDLVLRRLFPSSTSTSSDEAASTLFAQLVDPEEESSSSSKRPRLDSAPTAPTTATATAADEPERCAYCAEPKHEPGMRCPHKTDRATAVSDEEESDLEDYV